MDKPLLQLGFLFASFDPALVGWILSAALEPKSTHGANMVIFREERPILLASVFAATD
jgi:hypothetical protein